MFEAGGGGSCGECGGFFAPGDVVREVRGTVVHPECIKAELVSPALRRIWGFITLMTLATAVAWLVAS